MASTFNSEMNPSQPMVYQIRIKGHLGREWTDWFDGLTIRLTNNSETLLIGPVIDQAALYGLLKKVRGVGCHCSQSPALNPTRPGQQMLPHKGGRAT